VNGEEWQGWPAILPLEGGASGPAGPPTGFKIVLRVDREAGKATWVSRPGAARASTADESEEEEDRDQPAKRRRVR
jgi:phage-related minor tail protein